MYNICMCATPLTILLLPHLPPEGHAQPPQQFGLPLSQPVSVSAGWKLCREIGKGLQEGGALMRLAQGNGRMGIRLELGVL